MKPWIKAATDANQGAVGYATNGVAIFGPYNSGCCDATFNEIQTMDYWNGIRIDKRGALYKGRLVTLRYVDPINIVNMYTAPDPVS